VHPYLEIPGRLLGLVLILVSVAWALGWRRSTDPKERQIASLGGLFGLGGLVLLAGVVDTVRWPTYGFFMGLGCLSLAALTIHWSRKQNLLSMEQMLEVLLLTGVCGLIGARCVYLVENWDTQFSDRPPAMPLGKIHEPIAAGDTLVLSTHGDAPFVVTFQGDETSLGQLKQRIEAQGASHDLIVALKTTQHRGNEGIKVTERGLLLKTQRRGPEAMLHVVKGTAVKKLGLIPNSLTRGVATPVSRIFNLRRGGLTYFGSVMGVLLAAAIYLRFRKVSYLRMLDLVAPALPLGLFFGRLGCLANGCCWGREAGPSALFAVRFPRWSPAWAQYAKENLPCTFDRVLAEQKPFEELATAMGPLADATPPLHATQLYEGLTVLLVFFLVLAYRRWFQTRVGQSFAVVVLLQAPVRLVVEHFRRDHGVFFDLAGYSFTESQLVAVGMFSIAVPGMIYLSLKGRLLTDVATEPPAEPAAPAEPGPQPEATPEVSP
jgi:prolipoprotein diacylglyceryl transferase